jgi:hypothetical protein
MPLITVQAGQGNVPNSMYGDRIRSEADRVFALEMATSMLHSCGETASEYSRVHPSTLP